MPFQLQSFEVALSEYQKARKEADALERPIDDDQNDAATARLDKTLERLLRAESPSFLALRTKLRILDREYPNEWQPRHMKALLADAAVSRAA